MNVSELIAACGDRFGSLSQYKFASANGDRFVAVEQPDAARLVRIPYIRREGKTAEEAMEKLLQAINDAK